MIQNRLAVRGISVLWLWWALALPAAAEPCEMHLLGEARARPFVGMRAAAAHAMLLHWEQRQADSSRSFLPYGRIAGDEVVTSRAIFENVSFAKDPAAIEALLALDASQASYTAWRDCHFRQPGVKLALKEYDGRQAVVELIWAMPSGFPMGQPLVTTLQGPWVNASAPAGTLFPGLVVNGGFHWPANLVNPSGAVAPLNATVSIGSYSAQLQVPALEISPSLQFPRKREAWTPSPPLNDWRQPIANTQVPGEFLWLTQSGCLFAEPNARRESRGRRPFRYTWNGACKDGWLDGPGTLRRYYPQEGMNSWLEGRFEQGELRDGVHLYRNSVATADAAKPIIRRTVAAGQQVKNENLGLSEAPQELAQAVQAHLAALASRDEKEDARKKEEQEAREAWFTPEEKRAMVGFFGALVRGLGHVAEIKGAQRDAAASERAYQAHNSSKSLDYDTGARLLKQKLDAQRRLAALQMETASRGETEKLDAEFSQSRRSRGEEAPLGAECLRAFEREKRDASLEKDFRTRHMVNACPSVTLGVHLCQYTDNALDDMTGNCGRSPYLRVGPRQRWQEEHGSLSAGREMRVSAFCAVGSHPEDFTASKSTRSTGISWYRCVWD